MATPYWTAWYHWRDKGGNRAQTQLRFPFSLSAVAAAGAALEKVPMMVALSDAVLWKVSIWKKEATNSGLMPPISANVDRIGGLFYRNSSGAYENVAVPSIKIELLETQGEYAGFRLVEPSAAGGIALESLQEALRHQVTITGEVWDFVYVNGGLML